MAEPWLSENAGGVVAGGRVWRLMRHVAKTKVSITCLLELAGNTGGVSSRRAAPAAHDLSNIPFLELTERHRKRNLGNRTWDHVYILENDIIQ